MSYSVAALDHAASQMSLYSYSLTPGTQAPNEDSRYVQQKPAVPKTSRAPGYSSRTPGLAQRACVWIKEKFAALNSARLKFNYENACREALLALDLALSVDNPNFKELQLSNLMKCRERQQRYLALQKPETQEELKSQFLNAFKNRLAGKSTEKVKLSRAIPRGRLEQILTPQNFTVPKF